MLTAEDMAVLAHIVEDPDAWIAHALSTVGLNAVYAKCRRDIHVAAYRAAKAHPDYESWRGKRPKGPILPGEDSQIPAYAPRGSLPSAKALAAVKAAVDARVAAEAAKAAQQKRINNLFN